MATCMGAGFGGFCSSVICRCERPKASLAADAMRRVDAAYGLVNSAVLDAGAAGRPEVCRLLEDANRTLYMAIVALRGA